MPGTAALASRADSRSPWSSSAGAPVARSIATAVNGTASSSIRDGSPAPAISRRRPRSVKTLAREAGKPSGYTSRRLNRVHTWSSQGAAVSGWAAAMAPLRAPTEVPMIMSGTNPRCSRALPTPTCAAPSTPPAPTTTATGRGRACRPVDAGPSGSRLCRLDGRGCVPWSTAGVRLSSGSRPRPPPRPRSLVESPRPKPEGAHETGLRPQAIIKINSPNAARNRFRFRIYVRAGVLFVTLSAGFFS